ncbi:MAG: DUF1353 domain-containing protein [bacterium]|nr:DUF1353 domain-containing protein [bacterium]
MVAFDAALPGYPDAIVAHPVAVSIPMPVIRPIPLRTRGRSWWQRTKAWLWDAREWELQEDYLYTRPDGSQLMIPAGFRTDFASSPRAFWPVGMDPVGILLVPSLFHDFGYRHDFYLDQHARRIHQGAGKRFHDRLMREICIEVNGMVVPSTVAWLALDVFGWYSWWQSCKGRTGDIDLQGVYSD